MWQGFNCPRCGTPVASGVRFCSNCGTQLNWQQPQPPPQQPVQTPYYQQQYQQPPEPPKKKSNVWLMGCLGLIVLAAIIGGILAVGTSPPETSLSTPPPTTTPNQSTPSTTELTPTPEPTSTSGYIYENGAIEVGGDGEPIELINNPNATNPTYAELIAFIESDTTDEHLYTSSALVYFGAAKVSYICSDFAEDVHNNAEAAGIRAAWVGIDFEGGDEGHALNAFETMDRGLVYIDCTGEDPIARVARHIVRTEEGFTLQEYTPTSWDKVAYVEIGKEYGLISANIASSPDYSYCLQYHEKREQFESALNSYNIEVQQYNQWVTGRTFYIGSADYLKATQWEEELKFEEANLDKVGKSLGAFWEPLGIVSKVKVCW